MHDPDTAFPHHGDAVAVPGQDHLLTRDEVAQRIRMSSRTVRRLGAAGLLEEVRTGQRAVRITEASVERHLAERRINRSTQGTVSAA